ncbi:MAG: hypothetical protein GY833_16595 [Aestuariibacter sp.]|nr:hypothetical protein [Aestuariibacter sp.]
MGNWDWNDIKRRYGGSNLKKKIDIELKKKKMEIRSDLENRYLPALEIGLVNIIIEESGGRVDESMAKRIAEAVGEQILVMFDKIF